jgi:predicted PurR-regulated permease PerM
VSPAALHRARRPLFLAISAAVVLAIAVCAHEVLLPFVLATVIAYVLTPLVALAERRGIRRGLAVLLVYGIVLGSLSLFARAIAPRIAHECRALRSELPALATEAKANWLPAVEDALRTLGIASPTPEPEPTEPLPTSAFVVRPLPQGGYAVDVGTGLHVIDTGQGWLVQPTRDRPGALLDPDRIAADAIGRTFAYAQHNSLALARIVSDLVAWISRTIFIFFITLMIAAYVLMTRERIQGFFRSLVRPKARPDFEALLARIDQGLSGVVRGQLLICGINGVLSAIGFAFIGLKYWPVMALVSAVFSLVPIFGSIASAAPAVLVGLTQGVPTALFVLLWIIGIHQIEANLLNPKIMGDAAKIHPVLVIFSLLFGEHFFQVPGALLAVPVMSITQSVFLHFKGVIDREPAETAMSAETT